MPDHDGRIAKNDVTVLDYSTIAAPPPPLWPRLLLVLGPPGLVIMLLILDIALVAGHPMLPTGNLPPVALWILGTQLILLLLSWGINTCLVDWNMRAFPWYATARPAVRILAAFGAVLIYTGLTLLTAFLIAVVHLGG
jgi:hypothetical protein